MSEKPGASTRHVAGALKCEEVSFQILQIGGARPEMELKPQHCERAAR